MEFSILCFPLNLRGQRHDTQCPLVLESYLKGFRWSLEHHCRRSFGCGPSVLLSTIKCYFEVKLNIRQRGKRGIAGDCGRKKGTTGWKCTLYRCGASLNVTIVLVSSHFCWYRGSLVLRVVFALVDGVVGIFVPNFYQTMLPPCHADVRIKIRRKRHRKKERK